MSHTIHISSLVERWPDCTFPHEQRLLLKLAKVYGPSRTAIVQRRLIPPPILRATDNPAEQQACG